MVCFCFGRLWFYLEVVVVFYSLREVLVSIVTVCGRGCVSRIFWFWFFSFYFVFS